MGDPRSRRIVGRPPRDRGSTGATPRTSPSVPCAGRPRRASCSRAPARRVSAPCGPAPGMWPGRRLPPRGRRGGSSGRFVRPSARAARRSPRTPPPPPHHHRPRTAPGAAHRSDRPRSPRGTAARVAGRLRFVHLSWLLRCVASRGVGRSVSSENTARLRQHPHATFLESWEKCEGKPACPIAFASRPCVGRR